MKKLIPIAFLAVASALPMTIVACSSSSSSTSTPPATHSATPTPRTGAEVIVGDTASEANNPKIPLHATGLFADTGSIVLTGNGSSGTGKLTLSKGVLKVHHSTTRSPGTIFDSKTCAVKVTEAGTFQIVPGSTGAYKKLTGSGTFLVTFTGTMPRLKSGKCNNSQNANPVAGSSLTVFKLTGTFTEH
jgi:hypothetical protein